MVTEYSEIVTNMMILPPTSWNPHDNRITVAFFQPSLEVKDLNSFEVIWGQFWKIHVGEPFDHGQRLTVNHTLVRLWKELKAESPDKNASRGFTGI